MAAGKKKKAPGGASAFILMIGDEGAILIQTQKKRVIRRLFAQSPDPSHTRGFDDALAASPGAPLTLLVDMMDQSYVRQTLPPVSSLSVGKIVKRRLDKDFAPDDIKGYVILGREKTGRKDWSYLMVSLANAPLLQKWITFVTERPNPFKGIGVVPLEAQSFLVAAEKAILKNEGPKDAKPLEWQILVSHHKVGGFRQIVLRNGKLTFTRMAIPIGESLPDVIAGNIEQEMVNTLEYLKRMGLQDLNTLSIIVVASEEIKQVLDLKKVKSGQYHFYTPFEMANLLSLADAAQAEDHFGDVVISAFIAQQRKLTLPLHTPYTRKLNTLSLSIKGVRAIGILGTLAAIGWAGMTGLDVLDVQSQTEDLTSKQRNFASELGKVKEEAKILPKQLDTFTDVITIAKLFDKRQYDCLAFVDTLSPALQRAALISSYHWTLSDPLSVTLAADKRLMTADIDLHFLVPFDPHDQFIVAAEALMERVKKGFPQFEVTHSEFPGVLADSKELKTVIGETGSPTSATQTDTAGAPIKMTIKGPVASSTGGVKH